LKQNFGLVDYKLIPEFLNISFINKKGTISIDQFVKNLYETERIDILVKIFNYLEPETYYLGHHGFYDAENVNPLIDFYTSYNREIGKRERDDSTITHHIKIDIQILKKHAFTLQDLQNELNDILNAINHAQELNKKIASVYTDICSLDTHIIWRQHDRLYIDAQEELFLEEIHNEFEIDEINLENYSPKCQEPSPEDEDEQLRLEKLLKLIHEKEKVYKIPSMIGFDLERYNKILELMKSPHFDLSNHQYLIAKFAGEKTSLLESRLKEVYLQYGQPVRNPYTGAWGYTIADTTNFIGLLYRHFLNYVNLMLDGLGYIPICAWCKQTINLTAQQLRWLKSGADIYCIDDPGQIDSCRRKGITSKQNKKRSEQRRKKNQLGSPVESLADRKIINHVTGKKLLPMEEQGDMILQSISEKLSKI
jgi:hypothetical protein